MACYSVENSDLKNSVIAVSSSRSVSVFTFFPLRFEDLVRSSHPFDDVPPLYGSRTFLDASIDIERNNGHALIISNRIPSADR